MGYAYVMLTGLTGALPYMTGHALRAPAARQIVEQLLAADEDLFAGIVCDLAEGTRQMCRRSRRPGEFTWLALPYTAAQEALS